MTTTLDPTKLFEPPTAAEEEAVLARVSAARTFLSAKVPFLGFMTLRLRPRVAQPYDGVPTAGVGPDGTLVLNHHYCSTLTEEEMRGLVAHEVLHPALHFFQRLGSKDRKGFNVAHDFAINLIIDDFVSGKLSGRIKLPPGGLLDRKYDGMSAEEIYESFPRKDKDEGGSGENKCPQCGKKIKKAKLGSTPGTIKCPHCGAELPIDLSGGGGGGGGEGIEIELPAGAEPGDGTRGGGFGGDCRDELSSTKDGKNAGQGDASAQDRLKRDWQIAITAAAQVHERQRGQGSLPGGLRKLIDEMLNPKHHWADILSKWVGEHAGKPELTYQRPSRRSEAAGEILVGQRRRTHPDVTAIWDTSGSMNGEENRIFSEVGSICEELDLRLRVIIIDAAIHADLEDVQEAQEIAESVAGGGGSDFRPAFERLDEERNDSVVLAFTDGYISVPQMMPEMLQATLWVITDGGIDPTRGRWGQCMKLNKDDTGEWV
jgi:predicted metal-dependent peptidase